MPAVTRLQTDAAAIGGLFNPLLGKLKKTTNRKQQIYILNQLFDVALTFPGFKRIALANKFFRDTWRAKCLEFQSNASPGLMTRIDRMLHVLDSIVGYTFEE